MNLKAWNTSDPYSGAILQMLELEFPGVVSKFDKTAIFEAVVAEVVGSKQHRYGPTPNPEELVEIRDVIRKAMQAGKPIPFLVPWGASKQGPWELDLAELMALKQLYCLGDRVRSHYAPGVDIVVRLEDLTDEAMFGPEWAHKTDAYKKKLVDLHWTISRNDYVQIRLESSLMTPSRYHKRAEANAGHILEAMAIPEEERGGWLRSRVEGWAGDLPNEILEYYQKAYDNFYPSESLGQKQKRLAAYFGGAIARFQLGGTGAKPGWGSDYITISFTGIPWSKNRKRVFYRTIPSRYTNQHRAPWIGKGYVRIKGNEATPAVAGWNGDGLVYNPFELGFSFGATEVKVAADYVVIE